MTQKEFNEVVKSYRANHLERQKKLAEELQLNKMALKASIAILAQKIEPAIKEKKAKEDAYSLQRHLSHELQLFCENRKGLTSEGATVQFVADDAQVVFTIVVPKK